MQLNGELCIPTAKLYNELTVHGSCICVGLATMATRKFSGIIYFRIYEQWEMSSKIDKTSDWAWKKL